MFELANLEQRHVALTRTLLLFSCPLSRTRDEKFITLVLRATTERVSRYNVFNIN